jgi:hypothetical protein
VPRKVTERERLPLIEQLVERESNSDRKNAFLPRAKWCIVRLWLEGKVVMVQEDRLRASLQMPSTTAAQAHLRLRRIPAAPASCAESNLDTNDNLSVEKPPDFRDEIRGDHWYC